jgi:hypothetical protein
MKTYKLSSETSNSLRFLSGTCREMLTAVAALAEIKMAALPMLTILIAVSLLSAPPAPASASATTTTLS